MRPGVSIAAVALAHSLNANMARKWLIDAQKVLRSKPKPALTKSVGDAPGPN
jgi:transposase